MRSHMVAKELENNQHLTGCISLKIPTSPTAQLTSMPPEPAWNYPKLYKNNIPKSVNREKLFFSCHTPGPKAEKHYEHAHLRSLHLRHDLPPPAGAQQVRLLNAHQWRPSPADRTRGTSTRSTRQLVAADEVLQVAPAEEVVEGTLTEMVLWVAQELQVGMAILTRSCTEKLVIL